MKQMNHRFEHWYKLTHWMSPELDKRDDDHYENEVVQAMYIAYRAGYNKSTKDRKKEVKEQHMTTLREAAQQALEALKLSTPDDYAEQGWKEHNATITALRAALAEPVQEPVAWRWGYRSITTGEMDWRGYVDIPAHPNLRSPAIIMQPLYTAPPQRKPLTEEEIKRIDDSTHFHESPDWILRFARAIERAHGIGEKK